MKQTTKCKEKCYVFDVWIESGITYDGKTEIIRKIQIAGNKTLYNLARVITKAFGFYFDHCFGYYCNFNNLRDSIRGYELFVDIDEEPLSPHFKGVKKMKIAKAFINPGERMLFLFDYGDEWRFAVELKEIKEIDENNIKIAVLESIGKAPPQYPPCEEF